MNVIEVYPHEIFSSLIHQYELFLHASLSDKHDKFAIKLPNIQKLDAVEISEQDRD